MMIHPQWHGNAVWGSSLRGLEDSGA